jgi:hypothetical protein
MTDYQRISHNEWRWHDGIRTYAVKVFKTTDTLIWSSWVERPDALAFDEGIRQQITAFISNGAPEKLMPPAGLIHEMRLALPVSEGWFARFRRRWR